MEQVEPIVLEVVISTLSDIQYDFIREIDSSDFRQRIVKEVLGSRTLQLYSLRPADFLLMPVVTAVDARIEKDSKPAAFGCYVQMKNLDQPDCDRIAAAAHMLSNMYRIAIEGRLTTQAEFDLRVTVKNKRSFGKNELLYHSVSTSGKGKMLPRFEETGQYRC